MINDVRENKVDEAKLVRIAVDSSIPESVGLRVPRAREQVSNPERTSMTFHPTFLEISTRLPL